ncbi:gluconolactonase [Mucilaginibacter sp. R11]|uniref:Gluconolactonase n=1 Tax=Mucilaginibacter agri TaxID=2695265 RepID=A0A965ZDN2_9SPHI|nr:gluconolactonase [Mucilaginibacter agri]
MKAQVRLIEVASFGQNQVIGCKVSASGRLFAGFPKHEPFLYALAEVKNGKRTPYPDLVSQGRFKNVQDLWTDEQDNLWVLDASPAVAAAAPGADSRKITGDFSLYEYSLKTNKLIQVYTFDDLDKTHSALNDVRIDHSRELAYLSDPGLCAIVVLDLKTGKSRLALQNHPSTKADPNFTLRLDDEDVIDDKRKRFSSNINGIALTTDNQWFYYRAINQTKLYRISTEALASGKTDGKVELIAETGVCHGMTADSKGNIFLSDSPNNSITYVDSKGKLNTLVKDPRISWPDSMGISPDGYLYFSCSQMNRLPKFHQGVDKTDYPYRIYKVKLP